MMALLIGFAIGFVTAVPTGPINIAVMMKGLSNRTGQGFMIGAGSGFMDIIYCGAAMFGISTLMTGPNVQSIFQIATLVVFFFFGIRTTFFRIPDPHLDQQGIESPGLKRFFLLGIILYLSNPSFIAYWITVAGVVHGYGVLERSAYNNLLFAVGTGIGTTTWFFTLLELVEKHKMRVDKRVLEWVTRGFGVILLIISCIMGYDLIIMR